MSYFTEAHFLQNLARAAHMTCCEFDAPQFCKKVIYSTNIGNVSMRVPGRRVQIKGLHTVAHLNHLDNRVSLQY